MFDSISESRNKYQHQLPKLCFIKNISVFVFLLYWSNHFNLYIISSLKLLRFRWTFSIQYLSISFDFLSTFLFAIEPNFQRAQNMQRKKNSSSATRKWCYTIYHLPLIKSTLSKHINIHICKRMISFSNKMKKEKMKNLYAYHIRPTKIEIESFSSVESNSYVCFVRSTFNLNWFDCSMFDVFCYCIDMVYFLSMYSFDLHNVYIHINTYILHSMRMHNKQG